MCKNSIAGTIEDWTLVPCRDSVCISGTLLSDKKGRFEEKTEVRTSKVFVMVLDESTNTMTVYTKNSVYKLGRLSPFAG